MSSSSITSGVSSSSGLSSSMSFGRLPTVSLRLERALPSLIEACGMSSASGITAAKAFAAKASAGSPVAARKVGVPVPLVAMTTGGLSLNPKR
eukprot:Skav228480  [mRNA]  locus=scaffold1092:59855:63317:+ [translate_table: standard]